MVWELKKLSDVVEIISGGTPKSGVSEYWADEVPWITPKDMGSVKDRFVFETSRKISKLGLAKSSAKLIPENSVILSTRAPIGYLVINTVPMATNQGCRGLVVSEKITTNFLYYFLKSNVSLLNDLGTGTTFKELSKTALSAVHILVPHVEEQKRIVAILDEAFEQIDQAKANAEQNLKNARELFESTLSQILTQRYDESCTSKLEDITSKIGSGATPRGGQSSYKDHGISLIRSMNVHDRRFKADKLAFIDDAQADKLSNVIVEKKDVLLNITGASVARCCLMSSDYLPARVNQHVSIIRIDQNILSPNLLSFLLTSRYYKDMLLEVGGSGATREAITKKQIQDFEVTFPKDLNKQEDLVSSLLIIEEQTQSLEAIYQQKITALDELKQSLLQKAFKGELIQSSIGDAA
jgi:type I restriction enzyme S subunit